MSGQRKMLDGCLTGETGDSEDGDDDDHYGKNDNRGNTAGTNRVGGIPHFAEKQPPQGPPVNINRTVAVNLVQESDYLATTLTPQRPAPPSRRVLSGRGETSNSDSDDESIPTSKYVRPLTCPIC